MNLPNSLKSPTLFLLKNALRKVGIEVGLLQLDDFIYPKATLKLLKDAFRGNPLVGAGMPGSHDIEMAQSKISELVFIGWEEHPEI